MTYLFTVADISLLLAFYHNIFCFFTTDLQSDAMFVFAPGQETISSDISFLCHPVYHPDKGASMCPSSDKTDITSPLYVITCLSRTFALITDQGQKTYYILKLNTSPM